jgi:predicted adenylyl cyclase CyaB
VKRNIEIKARVRDKDAFLKRARGIADSEPEFIAQEDIFFEVPHGRLKLRHFASQRGELIFYERDDESGPKTSDYEIYRTSNPDLLEATLERALGVRGQVRKTRRLYRSGRTRIHLDQVEGLGDYMELEVVLGEGEDEARGEAEARRLMSDLGIGEEDLIRSGYIDLLERDA